MLALCCILLVGCGEGGSSNTNEKTSANEKTSYNELLSKLMSSHELGETRNQTSSRGSQVNVYGVSLYCEGAKMRTSHFLEYTDNKLTNFVIGTYFDSKQSFDGAKRSIAAGLEKDFNGVLAKRTVSVSGASEDVYEGYLDDGKIKIRVELYEDTATSKYNHIEIVISE